MRKVGVHQKGDFSTLAHNDSPAFVTKICCSALAMYNCGGRGGGWEVITTTYNCKKRVGLNKFAFAPEMHDFFT